MPRVRRWKELLVAAGLLAAVGCFHTPVGGPGPAPGHAGAAAGIAVPPEGAVPRELVKITLPPYVIEAPDQLLIEVIQRSEVPKMVNGKELKDPKTGET